MALLGAVLAACGGGDTDLSRVEIPSADSAPVAAAPAVVAAPAPPVEPEVAADTGGTEPGWTAGIVEQSPETARPATVRAVRAARNQGWDRTVWEFAGDSLPGYHLEYVDRPVRSCGSGEVVEVAGDGWLQVRLAPAQAHDEAGRSTLGAGTRSRMPNLPVLLQLEQTCDFEAVAEWVMGVAAPNRYRVLELRDPARLVVDVRH